MPEYMPPEQTGPHTAPHPVQTGVALRDWLKILLPAAIAIAALMSAFFLTRIEANQDKEQLRLERTIELKELENSLKEHGRQPTHPKQETVNATQEMVNEKLVDKLEAIQQNVEAIAKEVEVPSWKIKRSK